MLLPDAVKDILLTDLKDVVGQPIQHQSTGEVDEKYGHDHGHDQHHSLLGSVTRGGCHLLVDELCETHEYGGDVVGIFERKICDPKGKGALPEFHRHQEQTEKPPENGKLDKHGQTASGRIHAVLLIHLHCLFVELAALFDVLFRFFVLGFESFQLGLQLLHLGHGFCTLVCEGKEDDLGDECYKDDGNSPVGDNLVDLLHPDIQDLSNKSEYSEFDDTLTFVTEFREEVELFWP